MTTTLPITSIPALLDNIDAIESALNKSGLKWDTNLYILSRLKPVEQERPDGYLMVTWQRDHIALPYRRTRRVIPDRYNAKPQGKRGSGEYNHHRRGLSLFHAL